MMRLPVPGILIQDTRSGTRNRVLSEPLLGLVKPQSMSQTSADHTANNPTEAELDAILDTYFTALLGSTQNQDWAVVLGRGTKVFYTATGSAVNYFEFTSIGTSWAVVELTNSRNWLIATDFRGGFPLVPNHF
jgi:hypothetical protein